MGESSSEVMLLSVQPPYASGIVEGTKTVELRRKKPSAGPGQLVAIYASSPVCAVIGACLLEAIEVDTPHKIKSRHLDAASIQPHAYDTYFWQADRAIALHLGDAYGLEEPVPLSRLQAADGASPMQSWRYMSFELLSSLLTSCQDHDQISFLLGAQAKDAVATA
jgi:predicted transcriptional regulator